MRNKGHWNGESAVKRTAWVSLTVAIALAVVAFLVGTLFGVAIAEEKKPYCPTEDSCSIDYSNGEWIITEDES